MKFPKSGLYAITQTDNKSSEAVIKEVYAVIKGGAVAIQYRDKCPNDALYLARELLKICQQYQVPLIINDDAELAYQVGANGVHLGNDDGDIMAIRKKLGAKVIIGLSCYDNIKLALQAQASGVDYIAFGRFFPSISKPLASPAHFETLYQAKKHITVPIVAIGGILPENGRQLLTAGADVLAVISGVFKRDPETSANAYLKLFNS